MVSGKFVGLWKTIKFFWDCVMAVCLFLSHICSQEKLNPAMPIVVCFRNFKQLSRTCLRNWCGNITFFCPRLNRQITGTLGWGYRCQAWSSSWGNVSNKLLVWILYCFPHLTQIHSYHSNGDQITVSFRKSSPRESTTSPSKEDKAQPTPHVWFTALPMSTRQTTGPHHAPVSFVTQKHNNVWSYLAELFWAVIIL